MKNNSPLFKDTSTHRLPYITLFVLGAIILVLVYIGYDSVLGSDKNELTKANKLKNEELISDKLPDVALSSIEVQKDVVIEDENTSDSTAKSSKDLEAQKK